MKTCGILAVQGDFAKHDDMMNQLGVHTQLVRTRAELEKCDGLILPGGESTTLINLIQKHKLWDDLLAFGQDHLMFGTCAGAIILAHEIYQSSQPSFNLIDITIARNAYGRQIDSFIDTVTLEIDPSSSFEGYFIRAPKILRTGPNVNILARHNDNVVMAEQDNIVVATFHPELTDDLTIHEYISQKL